MILLESGGLFDSSSTTLFDPPKLPFPVVYSHLTPSCVITLSVHLARVATVREIGA